MCTHSRRRPPRHPIRVLSSGRAWKMWVAGSHAVDFTHYAAQRHIHAERALHPRRQAPTTRRDSFACITCLQAVLVHSCSGQEGTVPPRRSQTQSKDASSARWSGTTDGAQCADSPCCRPRHLAGIRRGAASPVGGSYCDTILINILLYAFRCSVSASLVAVRSTLNKLLVDMRIGLSSKFC